MALGRVVLLRADVPRREVEDAPAPDRVLDGRARGRVRRRSTTSWSSPRSWSSTSSRACSSAGRRELKALERDTDASSSASRRRSRASSYDDAVEDPQGEGPAVRVGRRLRRARRDGALGAVRSAGLRPPLSRGGQGVLHEARSRAAGGRAVRRRPRARRLRRDHRRRPAPRRLRPARCSGSTSTSCRRRRSSGISTCAATAACRTAASAWASSASCPGSAGSSTCARPSRIRGCSIGLSVNH